MMLQISLLVLKCVGYCDDVQNMVFGFLVTLDFSCLKKKEYTQRQVSLFTSLSITQTWDQQPPKSLILQCKGDMFISGTMISQT